MRNLILPFLTTLFVGSLAPAQESETSKGSDKLDIKKLEERYWSAKDDDFSVVQNRAYTKANKLGLSLEYGIPINDPYSTGDLNGFNLSYHKSERYGLDLHYLKANYRDNNNTVQFISDHATEPNRNVLREQYTVQFNYIPLYAKMSFLDRKIIYFDMGLGFILGQSKYLQVVNTGNIEKTGSTYGLSIYQHYFLSERLALKVDYRNTWTNEERLRYKIGVSESESARSLGSKAVNDSMLMFGLTFFLGKSSQAEQ